MKKNHVTDEGVELDGTLTNEDTVTDKTIEKTANHSGGNNFSREFVDEKVGKPNFIISSPIFIYLHLSLQTKKRVKTTHPPSNNGIILGAPEITANLYCNFVYLYWEGCVICSIFLR